MKFLLLIHNNPEALDALTPQQKQELIDERRTLVHRVRALRDSGELLSVFVLPEPATGRTVEVEAGTPVISDRPFLETKEYLAGAMVLNCASVERALELAALIPLAQFRRVQLREIRLDQDDFLAELGE